MKSIKNKIFKIIQPADNSSIISKMFDLVIVTLILINTVTIMICTPKVRHFWRCIFLWQRKDKNIENTRQNSNYLL